MSRLQIRVPASTANLGPGFDTLGIAVNLVNRFELICPAERTDFEIISGIDPSLREACLAVIEKASARFFETAGAEPRPFVLRSENSIPIARGLGSSGTMRLALLFGLRDALGIQLAEEDLLSLAGDMEGSTDNITASYYGGFTASAVINGRYYRYRYEVPPELDFVAVSPSLAVKTDEAREVFPPSIPRVDAILAAKHSTLLALAFANRDYGVMGDLFEDRLHQTYRQIRIPALKPLFHVIQAAREAGAIGGFLSGSGSTMMAVTLQGRERVAEAMRNALLNHGMDCDLRFLKADNQGMTVEPLP